MADDYEEYLDKYCKKRGIPREEAEKHYLVKEYKKFKEEEDGDQGGVSVPEQRQDL